MRNLGETGFSLAVKYVIKLRVNNWRKMLLYLVLDNRWRDALIAVYHTPN